jgi:hypothetical protein
MKTNGQRHASEALHRERNPISKEQEAGCAQSRSRCSEVTRNLCLCRDSNTGSFRPQRSHYADYTLSAHSSVFLCHSLLLGSNRSHGKRKHSQPTDADVRKYTKISTGIYEVSVTLTTKRVSHCPNSCAVPSSAHPRRSGYPPAWVTQHLCLRDGLQSVRNRHEQMTKERKKTWGE